MGVFGMAQKIIQGAQPCRPVYTCADIYKPTQIYCPYIDKFGCAGLLYFGKIRKGHLKKSKRPFAYCYPSPYYYYAQIFFWTFDS